MRVYKFLSTEYALWDVINRRLKISELRDMNDPLELPHLETAQSCGSTIDTESCHRNRISVRSHLFFPQLEESSPVGSLRRQTSRYLSRI